METGKNLICPVCNKAIAKTAQSFTVRFPNGTATFHADCLWPLMAGLHELDDYFIDEAVRQPIDILSLSPRAANALLNGGIRTMRGLLERDNLRGLRTLGKVSEKEIMDALKKRGLPPCDKGRDFWPLLWNRWRQSGCQKRTGLGKYEIKLKEDK